jgi:antitoxin component YwqK of YwqJK toxin-antitoxin module
MSWLIALVSSLAALVVAGSYRLLWRHRYGVAGVQGRCLQLRGRVTGPGERGAPVCRSSLSGEILLATPFDLATDSGSRTRVVLDSAHLIVSGREIRVGDRVTVVALHSEVLLGESLYRQSAVQPAIAALRLSRGAWPEARGLNVTLGLALLLVIASLGAHLRRGKASTGELRCPVGQVRGARPPVDHFQWCSLEVARGREIRQGPWVVWWDATHKQQEGSFLGDRAHGEWRSWDLAGRLVELATYAAGELQRRMSFGPDGRLRQDERFSKGQLHAERRTYDERGRLRSLRTCPTGCESGQRITWSIWDAHGRLRRHGSSAKGERDGEWRSWTADGKLRASGKYREGVVDGRWSWWHANGRIAGQGTYELGVKVGSWSAWHDNGVLRRRGEYLAGEEDGLWTAWDRSGRVRREGRYSQGIAVGRWLGDEP